MHSIKAATPFFALLLAYFPSPTTTIVLPRGNPVQSPFCSCGLGYNQDFYSKIINQIDTSKTYNVPWYSDQQGFTGTTTDPANEPIISVNIETSNGDGLGDAGTISGSLLQEKLNEVNGVVDNSESLAVCFSEDGTYTYTLGVGQSCY